MKKSLTLLINLLLVIILTGGSALKAHSEQTKTLSPPAGVQVTISEDQTTVKWKDPSKVSEFRYDNGECNGGIGLSSGTNKSVLGVVHKVPAELYEISWLTAKDNDEYNTINIFVFDIDNTGKPTSNILYSAMGVPNNDYQWSKYVFEVPVYAPNGFMLGVSIDGNGNVAIGADKGQNSQWPFVPGVNFITSNYTTGFSSLDAQNFKNNLMIRAKASIIDSDKQYKDLSFTQKQSCNKIDIQNTPEIEFLAIPKTKAYKANLQNKENIITGYKVWRFKNEDQNNESKWTLLTTSDINECEYIDNGWENLNQGVYKYAVKAVYNSGISSPSFSAIIAKNMLTEITIKTTTNVTGIFAEGALVQLTNTDNDKKHFYQSYLDSEGKVTFKNIWKGTYKMEISFDGFNSIIRENVDFTVDNSYEINDCILKEIIETPFNLRISKTDIPNQRIFAWNELEPIKDDFESHKDFTINSEGSIGWSYIDGDRNNTYGVNNVTFKNMGSPMAYIVFNPYQTAPPMSSIALALPHSGKKYLASFAISPEQSGVKPPPNDDYLISPELNYTKEFELKFWAKSYLSEFQEKFMVGYSKTGKTKTDFNTWITPNAVTAPAEWTEYKFTIPAEAKYITVKYVSQDAFLFMLDDIQIGEKPSGAIVQKYEIFLDGEKIKDSEHNSIVFENLSQGEHIAGIKSIFLSDASEIVNFEFTVDDKSFKVEGTVKNNDNIPLIEAIVEITGQHSYQTETDHQGNFLIPAVFVAKEYNITVKKSGYTNYSDKFNVVDKDIIFENIKMGDAPLKPGAVIAKGNDAEVLISWLDPTSLTLFRRDNGVPTGGLGSNTGTDKTVVGTLYKTPAELHSISWMSAKQGEHPVNLFIFDIDKDGMISKEPVFTANNVASKGMEWNIYHFEQTLNCPRGFFFGVSGATNGNVAIAVDSGIDPEWPFIPDVNFMAIDYTTAAGGFMTLDKAFPRNLMLRAEGVVIYGNKQSTDINGSKSLQGYKVWSLKAEDEKDESKWRLLTENVIAQTTYNDRNWENLSPGKYKYAVKAIYSSEVISEASFSNIMQKESVTKVTVKVKTSDPEIPSTGAYIKLINKDRNLTYNAEVNSEGKGLFEKIQKGIYNMTITLNGFAILNINDIDFSTSNNYTVGPFTLKEMLPTPTTLNVTKEKTDFERLFTWQWTETAEKNIADFYSRGFVIYEIFIDDEKVAETSEMLHRFTELTHGEHKAGVRVRNTQGVSETATVEFFVEEKLNGVTDESINQANKLYPNPVTGNRITVESINMEKIEIYDALGKLHKIVSPSDGTIQIINIEELSNGIYFIKIFSGTNIETHKVLINK